MKRKLIIAAFVLCIVMFVIAVIPIRPKTYWNAPLIIACNGRSIYLVMASAFMSAASDTNKNFSFEGASEFHTSSAYFQWVYTNYSLDLAVSCFSYRRFMRPAITNIYELNSENNVWCVLEDKGDRLPERVPVLFTSNLRGTNFAGIHGSLRDNLNPKHPLGTKFFAFVTKEGETYTYIKEDLDISVEDLVTVTNCTNRILRP